MRLIFVFTTFLAVLGCKSIEPAPRFDVARTGYIDGETGYCYRAADDECQLTEEQQVRWDRCVANDYEPMVCRGCRQILCSGPI